MSITTIAAWDDAYAAASRLATQIRSRPASQSSSIQKQQLQQQVGVLDRALQGGALPFQPADAQRRHRLLQGLQQQSGGSVDLLADPHVQQQQQPMSQMAMAMRQQDDMIDELAVGVSRLRDQTQVIGDEAKMHVNLLGQMETNLDAAQSGLESETRRAAQLREDQSVWRLQLIIAGLSVLFVLLILLGLS